MWQELIHVGSDVCATFAIIKQSRQVVALGFPGDDHDEPQACWLHYLVGNLFVRVGLGLVTQVCEHGRMAPLLDAPSG